VLPIDVALILGKRYNCALLLVLAVRLDLSGSTLSEAVTELGGLGGTAFGFVGVVMLSGAEVLDKLPIAS